MLSCTIVTTQANGMVMPVHERMPVILEGEGMDAWLGDSDDAGFSKRCWCLMLAPHCNAGR